MYLCYLICVQVLLCAVQITDFPRLLFAPPSPPLPAMKKKAAEDAQKAAQDAIANQPKTRQEVPQEQQFVLQQLEQLYGALQQLGLNGLQVSLVTRVLWWWWLWGGCGVVVGWLLGEKNTDMTFLFFFFHRHVN